MSDTEHTEDLGKRMHKPTEKSLVSFQSKCLKYQQQIEQLWNTMEDTILSIQDSDKFIKSLRKLDSDIRTTFEPYVKSAEDYLDFLIRRNSEASKS